MAKKISMLNKIQAQARNWCAKVIVISKSPVQQTRISFQKLILGDEEGNFLEAIIYQNDIQRHETKLLEGKTYNITGAYVKQRNESFENQIVNCSTQWTITGNTNIELNEEDPIKPADYSPPLTEYEDFKIFIGSAKLLSTLCIVVAKNPPKKINIDGKQHTIHNYAAINNKCESFVVTFWNDVVPQKIYDLLNSTSKMPIIMLVNFKVDRHYGISLTSTSQSIVLENDDGPAFNEMIKWKNANKNIIDQLIKKNDLFVEKISSAIDFTTIKTSTIEEIILSEKVTKFYTIVRGKLNEENQSFTYMCCESCNYGTSAEYDTHFTCNYCNTTTTSKPRYKFRLNVYDNTGNLDITVFGLGGQTLINESCDEFYRKYITDSGYHIDKLKETLQDYTLQLQISKRLFGNSGTQTWTYSTDLVHHQEIQAGSKHIAKTPLKSAQPKRLLKKSTDLKTSPNQDQKFMIDNDFEHHDITIDEHATSTIRNRTTHRTRNIILSDSEDDTEYPIIDTVNENDQDSDTNTLENEDDDKKPISFLKNKKATLKTKEKDATKAGTEPNISSVRKKKSKVSHDPQVGIYKANRKRESNQIKNKQEDVLSNKMVLTNDHDNEETKATNQNIPTGDMDIQSDAICGELKRKRKDRSENNKKTCEVYIDENQTKGNETSGPKDNKKRRKTQEHDLEDISHIKPQDLTEEEITILLQSGYKKSELSTISRRNKKDGGKKKMKAISQTKFNESEIWDFTIQDDCGSSPKKVATAGSTKGSSRPRGRPKKIVQVNEGVALPVGTTGLATVVDNVGGALPEKVVTAQDVSLSLCSPSGSKRGRGRPRKSVQLLEPPVGGGSVVAKSVGSPKGSGRGRGRPKKLVASPVGGEMTEMASQVISL